MTAILRRHPAAAPVAFLLAAAGIYAVAAALVAAEAFAAHPRLGAFALTVDLVLGVTALYYLLAVRGAAWPPATTVLVFLLTLAGAGWVLPAEQSQYLRLLRYAAPLAELALVGYVVHRVVRLRRALRATEAADTLDVPARLRHVLREVVGARRATDAVAYELALLYYAFAPRPAPAVPPGAQTFTYHRAPALGAVLAALLLAGVVELAAVHVLVARWSPAAAWGLTALSAYGLLWGLGYARSVYHRPVAVTPEAVVVRDGLRWEAEVPRAVLRAVVPLRGRRLDWNAAECLNVAPLGRATHLLYLDAPVAVRGLYGLSREVRWLGVAVDDAQRFEHALQDHLAEAS